MKRAEILKEAEKCVCGNREQDYGSPENNFRTIANFWATYLNTKHDSDVCITIDPEDVAAMLALLKIARISSGRMKDDNWIDLAGYAACGGEIAGDRQALAESEYRNFIQDYARLHGLDPENIEGINVTISPRTGLITEIEEKPQKKPWVEPEITVTPTPPSEGIDTYKGAFDPS